MKSRNFKKHLLTAILALAVFNSFMAQSPELSSQPYIWKNVQIVGGGFIDGIVFHPTVKNVRYCRTDMGGAYKWNTELDRWVPILDWIPYEDFNLMGIESIALDPSDANCVYLSCGTYTAPEIANGAILRSYDGGKTFQRTNVPFKMGGNENGRANGERMAVDPANGNILYVGTRHAGLWRSTDKAVTWSRVESFPNVTEDVPAGLTDEQFNFWKWNQKGSGIICVVFDSSSKAGKASNIIYVAVSLMNRDNLFRSIDGGKTWQPVPGQPTQYRPTHAVLAPDGNMYITYGDTPGPSKMFDGALWKYNTKTGEWKDISPEKPSKEQKNTFGYAAVSVDASNPNNLIVSSFGKAHDTDDIFRSTDGGTTWKPIFASGAKLDFTNAPYVHHTPIHWMLDVEIDPANPNHAMFTTGYGGWETFNLKDIDAGKSTTWSIMAKGVEETVPLDLLSPAKGAQVITAVGDYCGFAHYDLDRPQPEGCFDNPHFGNTNGLACAESNADLIVRVGRVSWHTKGGHIAYSLNGGKSWLSPASVPSPDSKLGFIAVSVDGSNWVWTPDNSVPYYTKDKGATWTAISALPANTRVIADKVNDNKFYAISLFDGVLYKSLDGGASFTAHRLNLPNGIPKRGVMKDSRGDERGGQDRIYAAPDHEGHLWVAAYDGLYYSDNEGDNFTRIAGVTEMHGFGFGKAAPNSDYSALYMIGVINGQRGIFRSDNRGKAWVRINDDAHQWGLLLHITGDPKKYGRVYVGSHGRGTFYGDVN
jgi:photosystem II stability/assembly factor-like uncharacterized protein